MERIIINSKNYIEFEKFYNNIFIKNFNNKNEYSSLEIVLDLIKNEYYDSLESNIILYKINNEIIAGCIFNYFDKINSIGIEFITVSNSHKRKGIGTTIVSDVIQYVKDFRNIIKYVFGEIELKNIVVQNFWEKLGFKKIDFNYIQPSISNKNPVDNLTLIVKTTENYISTKIIKKFIVLYSKIAILVDDTENNDSIKKMFNEIKNKDKLNLSKIKS